MVKHVSNKGFTLLEMLIVLFVISMLVVIFPFVKPQKHIQLGYEMQNIKQLLLQTQISALQEHCEKQVKITSDTVYYDGHRYALVEGMHCDPASIYYHANGNVNQAKTIRCSCFGESKKLVIELGSGAVYVR